VQLLRFCSLLPALFAASGALAADADNGKRLAEMRCVTCHIVSPGEAAAVLATLDPNVAARIERRAAAAAMIAPDFIAGTVREFVERADDELWLQLLTIMRKVENPGLVAIQTILGWVVADRQLGP